MNNNNDACTKIELFIKKLITNEKNSNLNSIIKLNQSENEIVYIKSPLSPLLNNNNNNNNSNNNKAQSPSSTFEEIEEYCFYLKDLPKTVKSSIFNQFSCLFIHLFQIEFNNNLIITNSNSNINNSSNNINISYNSNINSGRNSINSSSNKILKDLDGYQDCSELKRYLLTVHENLISLVQKNSFYWYDSILYWSLGLITKLTKLLNILKLNSNNKNKSPQSKNKSSLSPSSSSNNNISVIVKERLEYYSFKSLLSLVLHLVREESIERFLKDSSAKEFLDNSLTSTTPEYELGWLLCHLGLKNPKLILSLAFNSCLNSIESNNSNNNNNSSGGDINCFQVLEFLSFQSSSFLSTILFQQHIDKIIKDHKETNNSQEFIHNIKLFLILISKDQNLLRIALPSILDNLTSFSIEDFDKNSTGNSNSNSNSSDSNSNGSNNETEEDLKIINSIIQDILLSQNEIIAFNSKRILLALYYSCYSPKVSINSPSVAISPKNKIRFEMSFKLFELLIEKLEKQLVLKSYSPTINYLESNSNNNDQFYNEFINNLNHHQNIIFYLNQIEFNNPSSSTSSSSISTSLSPEIIKKNNILLKLISVIGVNSVKSSLIILTYLLTKFKSSNHFIEYFYLFAETFQAVNSNTIDYFINDIFKSIDSYIESDLLLLLNNLLLLVKTSPIISQSQSQSTINNNNNHNLILLKIHKNILKSTKNNWSILLNLIKHPNIIHSIKNIPLEILYHSFNNIYKDKLLLSQQPPQQQQIEKKNKNNNKSDQLFETRVLVEKILYFIFKNLRNLEGYNSYDKEIKRLKKFEEYKNFYLLLCQEPFYFTITIDIILDKLFTTETDMIIKIPALCPLSSANTIPPPTTFTDNSTPDINNIDNINNNISGNNDNQQISNNHSLINKKNKIQEEEEEVYFNQIIDPSLPLSQPLVISNSQPTLFENNYERKYYHYKFNDMNNPSHISFTNQPSKKKKLDGANELLNDRIQIDDDILINNNSNDNNSGIGISPASTFKFKNSIQSLNFNLLNNENDLMSFIKQLLNNNICNSTNNEQKEIKVEILTDQFLLRVIPNHPEPSYENYQEILPKQSHFERDIYIRNLFQQNPFLYRVLEIISTAPRQLIRCLEVIKSLLVNEISYWYQYKNYSDNPLKSNHYTSTIQLIQILINSQFIIHPLNLSLELIDIIKPDEISYILTSIWNFIKDYKPDQSQYQFNQESKILSRDFNCNTHPYSLTLKSIFHNHIKELCYHYSRFFPK